jgi:hypothetical protein
MQKICYYHQGNDMGLLMIPNLLMSGQVTWSIVCIIFKFIFYSKINTYSNINKNIIMVVNKSDEPESIKMLKTPDGQRIMKIFMEELYQSGNSGNACDKAVEAAIKKGILGNFQITSGLDLFTLLKYLVPIINNYQKHEYSY